MSGDAIRSSPDERSGEVPEAAIFDLFASVDRCAGRSVGAMELVDVEVARKTASAFKLDVSFDFAPTRGARFSINDKGEPDALRARAERVLPTLGLPGDAIGAFFSIAAPGVVQTTLAVKWAEATERPDRVSLYFEELFRCQSAGRIREDVFALAGAKAPPVPEGAEPVAVCTDYRLGTPVAVKTYDMFVERPGDGLPQVPAAIARAIQELPIHPITGTRRYMVAARHRPDGLVVGHKLLWMTEVHRPELVDWAWKHLDTWRARWATDAHADVQQAFDELRHTWRHAPATAFLHPDLVCLNFGPDGLTELIAYVSIR